MFDAAIESALGIPSDAGSLLSAYFELRSDKAAKSTSRSLLEQLARKATSEFDLGQWAKDQNVEGPGTQKSPAKVNPKRILARLAKDWSKPAKRELLLVSLATAESVVVDLSTWSSAELKKRYPISSREFAAMLSGKRYEPAIDAIASGRLAGPALPRAAKNQGLRSFCVGKGETARNYAKKGLMAGATIDATAVDRFIGEQYSRALITEALAKGKAPKMNQLSAKIEKLRKSQLQALIAKYGDDD